MPKVKYPLNALGRWLNIELDKRNISKGEISERVGINQQYLCTLMRSNKISMELMEEWKRKFRDALKEAKANAKEES